MKLLIQIQLKMDFNKKTLHFLLIIIIILIFFISVLIYYFNSGPSLYFTSLNSTELDLLVSVEDKLKPLRNLLQNVFTETVNYNKIKDVQAKDLKQFLHIAFKELNHVIKEYKDNNISIDNEIEFYKYFYEYIKHTKTSYLMSESLYNTYPFIKNMPSIVYYKHKYAIKNIKIKQGHNLDVDTFDTYINRLGLFLAYYKNTSKNGKFITSYEKKNTLETPNQQKFKKALVFVWKLGAYICYKIQNNEKVDKEFEIFNKYFLHIFNSCCTEKKFPFGYDWFLFASHYPTILSYKLYLDYKLKNIIEFEYIQEIFKFLPQANYSKHIRRYKSNVAIMSISFIIANLFNNYNNIHLFHSFMTNFLNSNVYHHEIIINYQEPKNGKFDDGLYLDDGFIIHRNLVSYNYLTAYLYPSLFYKIMFNEETKNIEKIFKSLQKFVLPNRKVNPVIVSRYGKFDEMNNVLLEFIENADQLQIEYDNKYIKKYKDAKNNLLEEIIGIYVIESARIVIANFDTWSIQIKINSELAYGEVDIYNKQILKQISMNKIMLFNDTKLDEFKNHSFYPGVLSYEKYLDNAESFTINYGTNTFTFATTHYTYKQLDKNTIFIYSKIFNKETKICYEEFIMITKYGIIVGYFNIDKQLEDDLNLTVSSSLIESKTNTSILYSDEPSLAFKYNTAIVKKVKKNILYSNLIIGAPNIFSSVNIGKNIKIVINFDKVYTITLNNKVGLQIYLN